VRPFSSIPTSRVAESFLSSLLCSSQAAAAWYADNLLTDMVCVEQHSEHLYDLLGWKYSRPTVSANLSNSETEDLDAQPVRGWMRTVSRTDRAVWPANYVHVENEKLIYNQPANA